MRIPVGEVLPLTRTSGDAPSPRLPSSSSKDQFRPNPSCLCLLESLSTAQPGLRAEDRGTQGRRCPGKSCSRCSRLAGTALSPGLYCLLLPSGPWCGGIQGAPVCCPLSHPSHQPCWQTLPFTHPYQGPGRMGGEQMACLSPSHLSSLKTVSKENPGSHCSILVQGGHPVELTPGGAVLEETAPAEGSHQRGPGGTPNMKSRQPHCAHLPGAPAQDTLNISHHPHKESSLQQLGWQER